MQTDREKLLAVAARALQGGRPKEAISLFQKALESFPQDLDAKLMLGIALARADEGDQAESVLRDVLDADPNCFEALNALSHLLRTGGNLGFATEYARRALELQPKNFSALHNMARCRLAAGQAQEAEGYLIEAIRLNSRVAALHHELGLALSRQGRIKEGCAAFQDSIDIAPSAKSYAELGELYIGYGNASEGIECLRKAAKLEPGTFQSFLRLARADTEEGHPDSAELLVSNALALAPQSVDALAMQGLVRQHLGQFELAERSLREVIRLDPLRVSAYYRIVVGRKVTAQDQPFLDQIKQTLDNQALSIPDRGMLHYALGKALDDLGEYEKAMGHYDEGNKCELHRLHVTSSAYDRSRHQSEIDQFIANYSAEFFDRFRGLGNASEKPVFIVGMERSGTTLTEQILSSHAKVAGAGELTFWLDAVVKAEEPIIKSPTALTIENLTAEYLRIIDKFGAKAERVTDKMPSNTILVGLIHIAFPNARIIWTKRQAVDNCLSIYLTPMRSGSPYLHDRANIVFAYKQFMRLLEHWTQVLPARAFMEIQYEDIVQDSERVVRQMLDFIGLEWDPACLEHEKNVRGVRTPSIWQARQPIYKSSMQKWRKYEPWLGEFKELLDFTTP